MTAAQLQMVDLSSNNATPNLKQHWAGGHRVVAFKATEGLTYNWIGDDPLTAAWHKLGGRVVHYHFARPGSGAAQAEFFLEAVKAKGDDIDVLALDIEGQPNISGYRPWRSGEAAAFSRAFLNRLHTAHLDVPVLVYGPPYFLRDSGIRPVHGEGLWIADYNSRVSLIPPGWDRWTAWQFTDKATGLAGIPGAVDCSKIRRELLLASPPKTPPMTDAHREVVKQATKVLNDRKHALNEADRRRVAALDGACLTALGRKP